MTDDWKINIVWMVATLIVAAAAYMRGQETGELRGKRRYVDRLMKCKSGGHSWKYFHSTVDHRGRMQSDYACEICGRIKTEKS